MITICMCSRIIHLVTSECAIVHVYTYNNYVQNMSTKHFPRKAQNQLRVLLMKSLWRPLAAQKHSNKLFTFPEWKVGSTLCLSMKNLPWKVKHLYNEVVYCNNCFTFHGEFLVDKHNVLKLVNTFSNKKPLQNTVTNKPEWKGGSTIIQTL